MSQIDLEDMKLHLSVADDDTGNDVIILGYISAAEAWVVKYLRRDLDTEFASGWPGPILQAVRLMVALWYHNREGVSEGGQVSEVPFGVKDMLASYRDLGA